MVFALPDISLEFAIKPCRTEFGQKAASPAFRLLLAQMSYRQ